MIALAKLQLYLGSPVITLVLTVLFILLNVLDAHSTWLVLRPDHYYRERNPIARWVFKKLKLPRGIIIFKTLLISILIPCIGFYAAWDAFTINLVLVVASIVFTLVVRHNYRVWKRIKVFY